MRHQHQIRIPFADADAAGIVYFARVFHYFHLAYEDLLESRLGRRFDGTVAGLLAPVVHSEMDFRAPLRPGDEATVELWLRRLGDRSWSWSFEIHAADGLRAAGHTVFAFVDPQTLSPASLPAALRDEFAPYLEARPSSS